MQSVRSAVFGVRSGIELKVGIRHSLRGNQVRLEATAYCLLPTDYCLGVGCAAGPVRPIGLGKLTGLRLPSRSTARTPKK